MRSIITDPSQDPISFEHSDALKDRLALGLIYHVAIGPLLA